jgi:DNA-binding NtrC family response regulator
VNKNVLLVEVKEDSLLPVNLILKFNGYEVIVCKNIDKAWEKAFALEATSDFCEFLITDIPVPRLMDLNFLDKRLHLSDPFPVYVISDFVSREIKKELEKRDCHLVEMPIDSQEFLKFVNKSVQNRKKRRYQ